ncbi:MAG: YtxH domain-containing protein [Anaerolineales bacterium]|jgi:gas vesicle protein|nr:YtxH domain-containing protein [Anaerolineales bacterium]
MSKTTNFLEGFILGGLVGVVVALMFAPSSGNELINRFQSEAERIRSEVSRAAAERRSELEQQLAALRTPSKPSSN